MTNSLLEALEKHLSREYTSFHMPGHKGQGLTSLARLIEEFGLKADVTELPGLDNLHCPTGPILAGEEQAAKLMGAKKTFFLVNGATGGILAGLLASTKPRDQVILPRNCHQAFWSAMVMGDLQPLFVMPEVYQPLQLVLPASFQEYLAGYAKSREAVADQKGQLLVLINPTYEGLVHNSLREAISWAREQKLITFIDEAHGSLFPLHEQLSPSAIQLGGDLIVHGAHKTLGSLTQTGLLHVGSTAPDLAKIRAALQTVQTTSPSYLLMASLVEATSGSQRWKVVDRLIKLAKQARKETAKIKGFRLVDLEVLDKYPDLSCDPTRLVISALDLGLTGSQLASILREQYGIQVEMAQWGYVVLLFGPGTTANDVQQLMAALKSISRKFSSGLKVNWEILKSQPVNDCLGVFFSQEMTGRLVVNPRESFYSESREVLLTEAQGEVAGEMICPYPPGIPVLYPGELISAEIVEMLQLFYKDKEEKMQTIKILR